MFAELAGLLRERKRQSVADGAHHDLLSVPSLLQVEIMGVVDDLDVKTFAEMSEMLIGDEGQFADQ